MSKVTQCVCPVCGGYKSRDSKTCRTCRGFGFADVMKKVSETDDRMVFVHDRLVCPTCHGTGTVSKMEKAK